jgi:ubiquitin carboxyl-terminal hydrolase 7
LCLCLQLDVKDCRDIYASFDKYCEVEVLEGENQYNAEQHGMQVRRSRVLRRAENILVVAMAGLVVAMPCYQFPLIFQRRHPHSLYVRLPPPLPRRSCFSVLQDARKGILFEGFPPVLQLQLKRFEYDFMKDVMIKVRG